jgi:ATP-dependent helicase HrpA
VRALPKQLRRQFVPAPDVVDTFLPDLEPADVSLTEALAQALSRLGRGRVSPSDWPASGLDDFYHMVVRVVDEDGKPLGEGRDLHALVERFRDQTAREVTQAGDTGLQRSGMLRWDIDALPAESHSRQAGMDIVAYPALQDDGDSVSVQRFDYQDQAWLAHRAGLARLAQLGLARPLRSLRKQMLRSNDLQLALAAAGRSRDALVDELMQAIVLSACGLWEGECRDAADFERALAAGNRALVAVAQDWERVIENSLRPLPGLRAELSRIEATWPGASADIEAQLADLLRPGFAMETPWSTLEQYPRYVKAIAIRLERLPAQPQKDRSHQDLLAGLNEGLASLREDSPGVLLTRPSAAAYWCMLQEFRVSLFAQHLGTAQPVSEKRLRRQWDVVESECALGRHSRNAARRAR